MSEFVQRCGVNLPSKGEVLDEKDLMETRLGGWRDVSTGKLISSGIFRMICVKEHIISMRDTYYDDDGGSCRREIAVEKPFAFDYGPGMNLWNRLQEPRHGALDPLQRTVLFQLEGWVDDLARFGIFSTSFKLNSRKRYFDSRHRQASHFKRSILHTCSEEEGPQASVWARKYD
ncbi:uncharacterized protein CIMG_06876 [Coccidioides immitis RS]|uniref:Uncharacterized protein n=1 Tax=Coccidioides immitis (strain RS) TaxID=246410 RepID=J3K948_COCIM|nr:uncharacterized protein CIMG_06876 [Coccidioides immitis RS]EAS31397.3 hypothetical protein CIMG_06876 [Coccidioides immitis RS]